MSQQLSRQKMEAMKYLKNEFNALLKDPILSLGCTVGLNEKYGKDLFHWKLSLLGPKDSPYADGMFFLTVDFPDNYPTRGPEVKFTNRIYHSKFIDITKGTRFDGVFEA